VFLGGCTKFKTTYLATQLGRTVVNQSTDHWWQLSVHTADDTEPKTPANISFNFNDFWVGHRGDIVGTLRHCCKGFKRDLLSFFTRKSIKVWLSKIICYPDSPICICLYGNGFGMSSGKTVKSRMLEAGMGECGNGECGIGECGNATTSQPRSQGFSLFVIGQPRTQGFCAYCSQKPWDNPNRNTIEHWCPRKRK
jgi:hypothetical protein